MFAVLIKQLERTNNHAKKAFLQRVVVVMGAEKTRSGSSEAQYPALEELANRRGHGWTLSGRIGQLSFRFRARGLASDRDRKRRERPSPGSRGRKNRGGSTRQRALNDQCQRVGTTAYGAAPHLGEEGV
jgi:hypothetical protein